MTFRVIFSPEARDDLSAIYLYVAQAAGENVAFGYIERIEKYCRDLRDFPERGARRDDLFPGLRVVGFERRVSIAFHIGHAVPTIDRILYGGRNLSVLRDDGQPDPPE